MAARSGPSGLIPAQSSRAPWSLHGKSSGWSCRGQHASHPCCRHPRRWRESHSSYNTPLPGIAGAPAADCPGQRRFRVGAVGHGAGLRSAAGPDFCPDSPARVVQKLAEPSGPARRTGNQGTTVRSGCNRLLAQSQRGPAAAGRFFSFSSVFLVCRRPEPAPLVVQKSAHLLTAVSGWTATASESSMVQDWRVSWPGG
jgi:hypothetical protein